MKSLLIVPFFGFLFVFNSFSENYKKPILYTSIGYEDSKTYAIQKAINKSIKTVFNVFKSNSNNISIYKNIINDICQNGNNKIYNYEILNEVKLPDDKWAITLKLKIDRTHFFDYIKGSGISFDFNESDLNIKIKQKLLDDQSEINSIAEIIGIMHNMYSNYALNFYINEDNLNSADIEGSILEIPLRVKVETKHALDVISRFFVRNLYLLTNDNNNHDFSFGLTYKNKDLIFYFNNKQSIKLIENIIKKNGEYYSSRFNFTNGIDTLSGFSSKKFKLIKKSFSEHPYGTTSESFFDFLKPNQVISEIILENKIKKDQLPNIKNYQILLSRKNYLLYNKGGIDIYLGNFKNKIGYRYDGLVFNLLDFGKMSFNEAQIFSRNFSFDGYDDWRLPTTAEMDIISGLLNSSGFSYNNLGNLNEYANFNLYGDNYFWTSNCYNVQTKQIESNDFNDCENVALKKLKYEKLDPGEKYQDSDNARRKEVEHYVMLVRNY